MMGKCFSFEIIRNRAKIAGISLLIFCVSVVLGFMLSRMILPDSQVLAANQIFAPPTYNWFVCEDLGLGVVPGVPGLRQILRLCHNQGWEIRAYCLQPGVPVPPIGSTCSNTPEDTFWCGDGFQILQEFAQDVTPTASPVPLETNTAVPTQTSLPSITITTTPSRTPTETLTPSATGILTDTPPPTITPRLTGTPTLTLSPTNTPRSTNSQTPIATITGQPSSSITPSGSSSETPMATSTNTPINLTATLLPSETVTQTPQSTLSSETPTPTPTVALPLYTPVFTPRPRPGGGGNIIEISLLGISLGILTFAIGVLSLLLVRRENIVLRLSFGLEKSQLLPFQSTILIQKRILLLVLLGLMIFTGYLVFTQIPRALIGFPQPVSGPEVVSLVWDGIHTPTPFQPRHPTPIFIPEAETASSPAFEFQILDFSPQSGWAKITIDPPNQQINQGKPITLSFIPDEKCVFGDQRACVSAHSTEVGNLVFLSIHSGYGGEGQAFRHAVEGTAVNAAAFSLAQVQANLDALQGAQVSVSANGDESGGFILKGVIRIPATIVEDYFALPIEDALELAGSLAPEIWAALDRSQPKLVFETCGWKMPAEPGSERVKNTTGSVYVVLIQPVHFGG
jgi:hypothetical protein